MNYKPVWSQHWWLPGINSLTSWPSSTIKCCYSLDGVQIHIAIFCRDQDNKLIPATTTSIQCNSQLASDMACRIEILERTIKEGYWRVQRGRSSGKQQSDRYLSSWRCIVAEDSWSGKTTELKRYNILRGSSKWVVVRVSRSGDNRLVSIYLEISLVRNSS